MIKQQLVQFNGAYRLAERLQEKGLMEDGWLIKSITPIIDSNGSTCGFYVLIERDEAVSNHSC